MSSWSNTYGEETQEPRDEHRKDWEVPFIIIASVSIFIFFMSCVASLVRQRWLAGVEQAEVVQGEVVEYV